MSTVAVPPPPGPGVVPPFVAPPTDGTKQRRWLAVGLSVAAALIVCLGGVVGVGGLLVLASQMIIDQSKAAVTDYLTAIKNEQYPKAYEQLCARERDRIDEPEFEQTFADQQRITSFSVGEPVLTDTMVVPATIIFDSGAKETVRYLLEQNSKTGEFEVCGEVG
jgi:hypothetical protein